MSRKIKYSGFKCHHKEKKSRLETTVDGIHFIELGKDRNGAYVPYCNFNYHPGLVDIGKAEICDMRGCRYYKKLYIK